MRYPLTDEAKNGAGLLVKSWDEGKISQHVVFDGYKEERNLDLVKLSAYKALEKFGYPHSGILLELAKYGLIEVKVNRGGDGNTKSVEVLLLQELRNAVENDFEVSEYFLTMNAVGTIVQGNLTMYPGAMLQSAASNLGSIQQSNEQIADTLTMTLGQQFVETQVELRDAINHLRASTEADRPSTLGKVVQELGRCLQHGANTTNVISGLAFVARFLV